MIDKKGKSQVKNSLVKPVVAAVAGVIVASVAVAGAIIMSDKKNQNKVKKVMENVKEDIKKI